MFSWLRAQNDPQKPTASTPRPLLQRYERYKPQNRSKLSNELDPTRQSSPGRDTEQHRHQPDLKTLKTEAPRQVTEAPQQVTKAPRQVPQAPRTKFQEFLQDNKDVSIKAQGVAAAARDYIYLTKERKMSYTSSQLSAGQREAIDVFWEKHHKEWETDPQVSVGPYKAFRLSENQWIELFLMEYPVYQNKV